MPRTVRIALGGFRSFGEPVREGIARFGGTKPGWVYDGVRDVNDLMDMRPERIAAVDGYLGGFGTTEIRARLAACGVPIVEMLHGVGQPDIPAVYSDDWAIGVAAAEHLLACGLPRVCVLTEPTATGRVRAAGVLEAAAKAGIEAESVSLSAGGDADYEAALARWAPPFGVVGTSDGVALKALETAARVGLRVPDDAAVVGVNDEVLACGFADPPLSSVRPDWERIGFEAAALLQRLMDGQPPPDGPVLIPPLGVTVRQSSDVLATDDDDVVRAVRWIRDHASEPGNVGDLLAAVPMARRSLERKFRGAFGHSPFQELRRQQVEHVKQLLIHTDWAMPKVAANSAFRDAKDLATQFRKFAGTTPTTYRAQHRSR